MKVLLWFGLFGVVNSLHHKQGQFGGINLENATATLEFNNATADNGDSILQDAVGANGDNGTVQGSSFLEMSATVSGSDTWHGHKFAPLGSGASGPVSSLADSGDRPGGATSPPGGLPGGLPGGVPPGGAPPGFFSPVGGPPPSVHPGGGRPGGGPPEFAAAIRSNAISSSPTRSNLRRKKTGARNDDSHAGPPGGGGGGGIPPPGFPDVPFELSDHQGQTHHLRVAPASIDEQDERRVRDMEAYQKGQDNLKRALEDYERRQGLATSHREGGTHDNQPYAGSGGSDVAGSSGRNPTVPAEAAVDGYDEWAWNGDDVAYAEAARQAEMRQAEMRQAEMRQAEAAKKRDAHKED